MDDIRLHKLTTDILQVMEGVIHRKPSLLRVPINNVGATRVWEEPINV